MALMPPLPQLVTLLVRVTLPRCSTRLLFFSSRRRHTRFDCDWSSDVCSSDLTPTSPPYGTSAAAPMVTGVVALMYEANSGLGWRDVQSILANSAVHVGSAIGGRSEERRVGKEGRSRWAAYH